MMRTAVAEIQRQVGDLGLGVAGLAEQGLLVRHLLMPGGLEEARAIFHFIAGEISHNCYLNIMDQYRPCGDAVHDHIAGTAIDAAMFEAAISAATEAGLHRLESRDLAAFLRRLMAH
jgi:putative pyruvate formate lyase activating enzyme